MSSKIEKTLASFSDIFGIEFSSSQQHSFNVFYQEVLRFSDLLGLTSIKDDQIILKHFVDSLLPIKEISRLGPHSVLDIGSGAGFPGLCLAVGMPDTQFTLCERNTKKAGFLLATASLMQVSNVEVFAGDFKELKRSFDLGTCRALTQVTPKFLKKVFSKMSLFLAYKGREDETTKEMDRLTHAGIGSFIYTKDLTQHYFPFQRTFLWAGRDLSVIKGMMQAQDGVLCL